MLRGLFDRIVLVAAIAAAACVPGYIAQYRQYLAGRLEQVTQDLALFSQSGIDRLMSGAEMGLIERLAA